MTQTDTSKSRWMWWDADRQMILDKPIEQTDTSRLAEETAKRIAAGITAAHRIPISEAWLSADIESALTTLANRVREEDARICEAEMLLDDLQNEGDLGYKQAIYDCAAAIRARQEPVR